MEEPRKEEETSAAGAAAIEEEVWSWGAGTDGQLGTAKLADEHLPQLLRLPSLTSLGSLSMLACGGAHVIALSSGGKVLSWGRGSSGQLGHGDMLGSLFPKPVSSFHDTVITHVAAGWSHSGFVSDTGCLFTCGDGSFGQLGHGDNASQSSPAKVSYFANKNVQMVACGMRHSLVLLTEDSLGNRVYACGSGKRGQLGISSGRIKSVNLPQVVSGTNDVQIVRVSANGDHSAAFSADGDLFTWGRGFSGCPDAQIPQRLRSSLPSLSFSDAVLGWNHALLLSGDGEVFTLGHTLDKQSEKPSVPSHLEIDSSYPCLEKVPGLDGVKVLQIAAGAEHSTAITEHGELKTWGWGEHGQLGLGDTSDQTNPQLVNLGLKDLQMTEIKVYCGSGFTYAVRRRHQLSSPT